MPLQGIHEFLETHVVGGHAPGTRLPVDAKEESKGGEHGNTADKAMKKGRYISNQIMAYMKWYHSKAPHPPKPDLHKWTKAILNTLRSMRWVPLKAEAPVLVRDWCLRTRVDLLVYDAKNKRVMVVEIKTGYADGAFQKARGTFAPPFASIPNSPRNRAYAQALIALAMLRVDVHARYTWMPAATGAWTLCVNDDGVTTCGSAPWSLDFVHHWVRFLQHHGAQRIGDRTLSEPPHDDDNGGHRSQERGTRRRRGRRADPVHAQPAAPAGPGSDQDRDARASASSASRAKRRRHSADRDDRDAGARPADRAEPGSRGTAASDTR
jgi:hypothetical protein